jgi:hypothetical protein
LKLDLVYSESGITDNTHHARRHREIRILKCKFYIVDRTIILRLKEFKGVTDGPYISKLRHEKKLIVAAFLFLISISFQKKKKNFRYKKIS